jgi:PAS domain S-box-containing protein
VILALVALTGFWAQKKMTSTQTTTAAEINVAGRQRMLSQRLALLGLRLDTSRKGPIHQKLREEYTTALTRMELQHEALTKGSKNLGISPPRTDVMRKLYFEAPMLLDEAVRNYISSAKELLEESNFDHQSGERRNTGGLDLAFFNLAIGGMIEKLEMAVSQYEADAEEALRRLEFVQNVSLGVGGIVLLFLGGVIFYPMARQITTAFAERDDAEAQLNSAKHNLELVLNSAGEGIYGVDKNGITTFVNEMAGKLLGCEQTEIIGKPSHNLIHHKRHDGTNYPIEACPIHMTLQDGKSRNITGEFFFHKNGKGFPVDYTVTPVYEDKELVGAVIVFRDMTEKHFINIERLKLSQAVEQSSASIFITDTSGIIEYVNPAFEKATGYKAREAVGQNPRVLKSGELYYETAVITPVKDLDGKIINYIAIKDDITERRKTEKNLKLFSMIIEHSEQGIGIAGIDTKLIYVNDAHAQLFDMPKEKLIGMSYRELLDDPEGPEIWEMETLLSKGNSWKGILPVKSAHGRKFPLNSATGVVPNEFGEPAYYFNIMSDFTEEQTRRTEIETARNEAEKANRAKSEFLSNMSHELRTPLNAVIGFAQMLESNPSEPLTGIQQKCVSHIAKSGDHLLNLINEVLDLSKIESGKLQLSIEAVRLHDAFEECVSLIAPAARKQGIIITVPDTSNLAVQGDRVRVSQILLNLLSNAVKYNRPQGKVEVACENVSNDMIRISVKDNGQGIPANKLDQLFIPFNRLGAEGRGIEGTGIGLSITKRLIEMMGGTIGVESKANFGSTFWVELPAAENFVPPLVQKGPAERESENSASVGTVLYIEDNKVNAELMGLVVAQLKGVKLLIAPTGGLGLAMTRLYKPDLLIIDINLPDINGKDVLKELRNHSETKHITALALSASATERDIADGMQAGFKRYLTKPFNIKTVLAAISEELSELNQPT